MQIPAELKYTASHEWVLLVGNVARIGLTDYAQDSFGAVVYIGLPQIGAVVGEGECLVEVESSKSISEVASPFGGVVSIVNADLEQTPENINRDPYGKGWLCELLLESLPTPNVLLDSTAYRSLIEGR